MLRVLHLAALPFPTHQGTQVYIRQMCDRQAERLDVHLLTYAHGIGEDGFAFRHHRAPDFPRHRSLRSGPSWRKPLLDLGLAAAARALVRRVRPHLIHAHHYEGLAAALAAAGHVPVLYHAHTLLEPELPMYFASAAARATASISGLAADRIAPRLAHRTVTVSPYLREALVAHGLPAGRVTYLPPALEIDSKAGKPPAGGRTIVYLGNLDRYQGVDDMLRCFAAILGRHGDARLRIVTDSDPSGCLELARSLGIDASLSVEPHGDFSTVLPRLLESRVAVVPRVVPGGFPIKLLNYLHARVPVVASTHGAVGLRHDSEAMVYSTPHGFVECTSALLADDALASRIAEAGQRFAASEFSWARSLDRLDAVYDSLVYQNCL